MNYAEGHYPAMLHGLQEALGTLRASFDSTEIGFYPLPNLGLSHCGTGTF